MSQLTRVLEPEVMDQADAATDYDAMDFADVNARFVDDLLAAVRSASLIVQGHDDWAIEVLDVGTGTARIPIELCRRRAGVRVVAVDLAESMLQLAARNVAAAGLQYVIKLEWVDGKRLPYADGQFTVVMSNSLAHHLAEPLGALREILRVTARGGLIFVRDLFRPADERELGRIVAAYASNDTPQQRSLFRDSLWAALTIDELRGLVSALGYSPATVQATSDRHWTWATVVPT